MYHGSYPRPYHEKLDIELWYHSYIRTYLERDVTGIEVDGLIEHGEKLQALEIKSSMIITPDLISAAMRWQTFTGDDTNRSLMVYAGKDSFAQNGIEILPWNSFLADIQKYVSFTIKNLK